MKAPEEPLESRGLWRTATAQPPRLSHLPAASASAEVSQAPAADRSSLTCFWFLKDKPKSSKNKIPGRVFRLLLLWVPTDASPREFGGTCSIGARWRVGGGWRISSSQQKAVIKVPADSRSLLRDCLSCHCAHAGDFGAHLALLGQSWSPRDTDGSARPAGRRTDPSALMAEKTSRKDRRLVNSA